ncbi:MAG: hypothetical protein BWY29_01087 [Microgenomates group bacterium ADurb.Bin238]|nr:MAG: hypothetical protein BWY29_01087 [Microgenomates group bacterium ADurb.Bin238]
MGGDLVDAFCATKHPTGMSSDALSPDEQVEAMTDLLNQLDRQGKLGGVQTGNHDNWSDSAGYRFERFLSELSCPVFSGEGEIDLFIAGAEKYTVWWAHTTWGNSKINITNAPKRALQFNSERADIALVGHTHQASAEQFDIAGKSKVAIVGGTYKTQDSYGKKWGMGSVGLPGYTLLLWPDSKHVEVSRTPEVAQDFLLSQIYQLTTDESWVDPYTRSKK